MSDNETTSSEPRTPWLPCGCMLLMILMFGFLAGGQYLQLQMVQESEPYQLVVKRVRENATCRERLGAPIQFGMPREADIEMTSSTVGRMALKLPVTGSRAEGTIHATGNRSEEAGWVLDAFTLTIEGRKNPINLGADVPPDAAAP